MNKKSSHVTVAIIVGVLLILMLYSSINNKSQLDTSKNRVDLDSGNRLVMGTFARIVVVATDSSTAQKCIKAAFEQIQNVDRLMSDYKSDSEISELNQYGFERAVRLSKSTYEVLERSIRFSRLTAGAFDITVGPLVDLWRRAAEANSVPSDDQLAAAAGKVGYEKLILDPDKTSVRFATEGMRVDLGGIAKGFAVDKAIQTMQKDGALGAMVDIGGDIRCFGAPPRGKSKWVIGLQDPNEIKAAAGIGGGRLLLTLELKDGAVATSGDYQQFTLIEGKRHSHIIDRNSHKGAQDLSSVTIIAETATDADALATAVSVMGQKKGLELIESLDKTEAILIPAGPKQQLVQTEASKQYISQIIAEDLMNMAIDKTKRTVAGGDMYKKYQVARATEPPKLDGNWDGEIWGNVEAIDIKHYMGDEPEHKPRTQAKLLYDDEFIYVIFRVEDKFVRAVAINYHDSVYQDSCVEFFFSPGDDTSIGYFNIEMNCGGTMLFHYQSVPGAKVPISDSDCDKVKIFHSEPKIVEPEKKQPTIWVVEYRVPIDVLKKYCSSVTRPRPGVCWWANFYKCADKTSHPHWLTWSVVDNPQPNFHLPQFFGTLEFK